ncbi:hypothetical protein PBY51_023990 [Eleginops maclovinus]|uniref:B30.2/SPRY domain-containing protein n=2 Tax=Eleginops maclovinus TaxID=56733 RepID=A0AAN7XXR2_ELEMC|nr:hypothetical protein PBY51_023990 [Eleginops maclovinus]
MEEPTQEKEQKVPEISLQEDNVIDDGEQEDQKDKNTRMKDLRQTSQRDKRSISPLSFIKEDLSQFKEEVWKVFRDKDTNPLSQAENKPAIGTLKLLKEDLSQFKEDMTSVFSVSKETKSTDTKTSQSAEKTMNRLSFLNFKDDLSNVFRIGSSKERDNKAKEESSNTFKITAESLFRRDQKTLVLKAENCQEVKNAFSEKEQEQMDAGFKGNLSESIKEKFSEEEISENMKDRMNGVEGRQGDITVSDDKSISETIQTEEMVPTPQAESYKNDDSTTVSSEHERIKEEEEEEEPKSSDTLSWEPLSSESSIIYLRDPNKDHRSGQPGGDLWSLKNFACYLTFDPNTANSELRLSEGNRKVTRVWSDHRPTEHPDRFERCPQVLCREGLLDSVYWEVVWSGGADIGVSYNSISRDGDTASSLLGHNERSWSLECSERSYTPCHQNKRFRSSSPQPFTHRVGVYLNWSVGSLSFYCVSHDTMVHLHTFTSTFTESLYPCFWVWAYEGSVALCQVELDWERLLQ